MLEKPALDEAALAASIWDQYGLEIAATTFLPLGADSRTAVFRATTPAGTAFFLKLRSGSFDPLSVELPGWLAAQGIAPVIAPLTTRAGSLWGRFDDNVTILYPFIDGQDGYAVSLSGTHWHQLGAALKGLHSAEPPVGLWARLRREAYSSTWREMTRTFLHRVATEIWAEPVAAQAAELMRARRVIVMDLIDRAQRLARDLIARPPREVVCHSDIHAGNVLLAQDGTLYIVDWDDPVCAPKERDLMYVGAGLFGGWRTPDQEEALFYAGYGEVAIDERALAYYRYERIVIDIALYCEALLTTDAGGDDRAQSLRYLASNFEPGQTIDTAYRADHTGLFPETTPGV